MGKLFPPFKVDIAGALCVPFTLRDARNRYQHGQISLSALRAIENKEICKLMERLKLSACGLSLAAVRETASITVSWARWSR